MSRYSALALVRRALTGDRWQRAWRAADPKPSYDVIVIGGGGHGLATAYYLARNHGIHNVAVLERGYLGSGNVGRNTTLVRSNYLMDGNTQFFEHSLKLWEGLSHELNYNIMLSQRGQIVLAHGPSQLDVLARKGNIMRLNGIDAELLDRADVMRMLPFLDYSPSSRFPIYGGVLQRRAGTVRHDAVAWGYARAADRLGVDIIEQCEVTGFVRDGERITGVETTRGRISAGKTAISVAGHSSQVAALAGLRLPVESHLLQAFVSEPIKPFLDHVVSFGAELFYISQSDKGGLVFGGHIDGFNSYTQRGQFPKVQTVAECAVALIPSISRLRLLRHWAGIQDMTPDGSPFIGRTPLTNLYLNGGWCYQGFKATPAAGWCLAHTIAHDAEHPLNRHLALDRFEQSNGFDEYGLGLWTYKQ
ncbi:MAG TPA: sarcosine oxidase subunit beta family protein [Steroidobacteraceae bacterium]|nr:sarcosine oxidase subunit beta family protein [Steroidobacteraceae bacterium]